MPKKKIKYSLSLNIKIFEAILGAFAIFFAGYILVSTGIFNKTPKVDTKAENTFAETIHVATDKDYQPTKIIRNLENKDVANIPIIAMTANTFEEDRKLAIEEGMNDHIGKPFDISDLKKALAKFKK
ncbi:MAG: response regulator [Bacilli bacterium]|nr:response regulator [Bacilli bacterium]